MAARQVLAVRKNDEGDVTVLFNSKELWSPRFNTEVISEIESGMHSYYVLFNGSKVNIHVVNDPNKGKYLRTDPDKTEKNNLDLLPNC